MPKYISSSNVFYQLVIQDVLTKVKEDFWIEDGHDESLLYEIGAAWKERLIKQGVLSGENGDASSSVPARVPVDNSRKFVQTNKNEENHQNISRDSIEKEKTKRNVSGVYNNMEKSPDSSDTGRQSCTSHSSFGSNYDRNSISVSPSKDSIDASQFNENGLLLSSRESHNEHSIAPYFGLLGNRNISSSNSLNQLQQSSASTSSPNTPPKTSFSAKPLRTSPQYNLTNGCKNTPSTAKNPNESGRANFSANQSQNYYSSRQQKIHELPQRQPTLDFQLSEINPYQQQAFSTQFNQVVLRKEQSPPPTMAPMQSAMDSMAQNLNKHALNPCNIPAINISQRYNNMSGNYENSSQAVAQNPYAAMSTNVPYAEAPWMSNGNKNMVNHIASFMNHENNRNNSQMMRIAPFLEQSALNYNEQNSALQNHLSANSQANGIALLDQCRQPQAANFPHTVVYQGDNDLMTVDQILSHLRPDVGNNIFNEYSLQNQDSQRIRIPGETPAPQNVGRINLQGILGLRGGGKRSPFKRARNTESPASSDGRFDEVSDDEDDDDEDDDDFEDVPSCPTHMIPSPYVQAMGREKTAALKGKSIARISDVSKTPDYFTSPDSALSFSSPMKSPMVPPVMPRKQNVAKKTIMTIHRRDGTKGKRVIDSNRLENEDLGSDDDLSSDEEYVGNGNVNARDAENDIENIVICLFDKISRNRRKWKLHLRSGIVHINGKDFIFNKGTGDAQF